jgi:hypothetical protein
MAAFFAINITQFHHDATGGLSLGYVSSIMCKNPNTVQLKLTTLTFLFSSNFDSCYRVTNLSRFQGGQVGGRIQEMVGEKKKHTYG